MRTIITILLGSIVMYSVAQPTYVASHKVQYGVACINSEWKYQYVSNTLDSIVYLNSDYSVYKVIHVTIPSNVGWLNEGIGSITQNFITTDGLVSYIVTGPDTNGIYHSFVYEENGTLLLSVDSGEIYPEIYISGSSEAWGLEVYHLNGTTDIYSVPGNYCASCASAQCATGLSDLEPGGPGGSMDMFPNPSNNKITINYRLPEGANKGLISMYAIDGRLIKQIPVTGPSGTLSDSAAQPGAYFYQLSTADGSVIKKQIYVR